MIGRDRSRVLPKTLIIAFLLSVPGAAIAQYDFEGMDLGEAETRERSRSAAPAAAAPDRGEAADAARDYRPTDPWALGIGAGWQFPRSILEPNIATARIAFPGTITFEPQVALAVDRESTSLFIRDPQLPDDVDDDVTEQFTQLAVGTQLRIPAMARGNLDLQMLGGVLLAHFIFPEENPDDDDITDSSSVTVASLNWGLGIEWFFRRNMAVSVDAVNPLLQWQASRFDLTEQVEFVDPDTGETETGQREVSARETTLSAGLIFDPQIRLMFHIYF